MPLIFQHPLFELQRDEFLYYQQGLHPALGYLENPPMLSWLATVSSWAGGSEIAIKFWPCLFGAATVVLTCLITAEFGGKSLAQLLAALGVMGGAFVRIHALFQPNFLDVFFWTLSLYFLVRYVNTKQLNFIFLLAISLALGWWSKYSVLFMAASVVVGLALSPYRAVFVKKQTWLAAAFALLLIAPNVVWQYQHNWPLVHHMAELRETQLQYINKADFIKDQLMML
ncbi:MAG TPA: glycosyltransferase family 39 protein, partial [Ferruginibacter sp.]|nr:glycosyltransferase family 39 protein [Ferruginibacter sp.]